MEKSFLEIIDLSDCSKEERRKLLERSGQEVAEVYPKVESIISEVKARGVDALLEYTEKFDGVNLSRDEIKVTEEEISQAYDILDNENVEAIRKAAEAIERFHKKQLPREWMEEFEPGITAGQVVRSLETIGAYVPGGAAQYPTTVLMAIIPAKIAGVDKKVICTPPNSEGGVNSPTLVAADIAGVDEVHKLGGAQAIGAMAYGIGEVSNVEKIVGPGNVYVAAAKEIVSTDIDIDFMAGPSEVLILADSTGRERLIAMDLVAQAEHDPNAASVLVTTSRELAEMVVEEIEPILENIPKEETAREALQNYGRVLVAENMEKAIDFINDYAPEHLEIVTENPEEELERIRNAGSIFLGMYSPTSVGDFTSGPNHILPTGGDAKRYDGLSVLDFVRMPTVQKLTKEGLSKLSLIVERLSEMEDLSAHGQSVKKRLEEDKNVD